MRLYLVCADDLDLVVWALTPDQAASLWRRHYDLDEDETWERIFEIPTSQPDQPKSLIWGTDLVQVA